MDLVKRQQTVLHYETLKCFVHYSSFFSANLSLFFTALPADKYMLKDTKSNLLIGSK